jgi:hypothetical protein
MEIYKEWKQDCTYTPIEYQVSFLEFLFYAVIHHLKFWYCSKVGHKLIDEGYANPESGCIDMVCQRCGWSTKVILY